MAVGMKQLLCAAAVVALATVGSDASAQWDAPAPDGRSVRIYIGDDYVQADGELAGAATAGDGSYIGCAHVVNESGYSSGTCYARDRDGKMAWCWTNVDRMTALIDTITMSSAITFSAEYDPYCSSLQVRHDSTSPY
jgi:hypothetical protein